jgi:hypothetical protein
MRGEILEALAVMRATEIEERMTKLASDNGGSRLIPVAASALLGAGVVGGGKYLVNNAINHYNALIKAAPINTQQGVAAAAGLGAILGALRKIADS